MERIEWIIANWKAISVISATALMSAIGVVSVIIRCIPTLSNNNVFLPIVKFASKWMALNKKHCEEDRPL